MQKIENLLREKHYNDKEKIALNFQKFIFEDECLAFEKEIIFNSKRNSIVVINIDFEVDVAANFLVYFNEVCVLKNNNKLTFSKNIFLNSDDVNSLKIESDLSSFGNIKIILIFVSG